MVANGISAFGIVPAAAPVAPNPVIAFYPNYIFSLAESVRDNATQRNDIIGDIAAIYAANGIKPDISANFGWSDAETTIGNFVWTDFDVIRTMAETAGVKWWAKLFYRTYKNSAQSPTPCVPPYMRSTGTLVYAGTYGGTGTSSNGEYYAGSGSNQNSANAKLHEAAVADRLQAWIIAIGNRYNDVPSFAGVIVNETSILGALTTETGMSTNPGTDPATYAVYLDNLFNVFINARSSLSKCELIISPNNPQEVFTQSPTNATTLFEQHQIGFYIQDAYKVPPSKFSVDNIYSKTQPYKTQVSGMYNLSGEVSSHKANSATNVPGYPLLETIDYAITTNGATHMVFQVNATTGTSSNALRYQEEVNILKTTGLRPRSIRPSNYPTA